MNKTNAGTPMTTKKRLSPAVRFMRRWNLPEALQRFGEATYTVAMRRDVCAYCGKLKGERTLDHIVPQAKGGSNHWSNYTGACFECNNRKGTMPLLHFLIGNHQKEKTNDRPRD